jgi:hypothetical protein
MNFLFRNDLHAAMELLLTQSDIVDDESDEENQSNDDNKSVNLITKKKYLIIFSFLFFYLKVPVKIPLFSRNGPFISFRKFRQQRFQPNGKVKKNHKFL